MPTHAPVNRFDLTSAEFIADPYPTYRQIRRELPVCWDETLRAWVVSPYADAHAALRDRRWSANRLDGLMGRLTPEQQAEAAPLREILTNRLVFTDDDAHQRLRGLMQLAFTPRRVEMMRPAIRALADGLLEARRGAGRIDLIADFADPLSSQVIAALLGLPPEDQPRFKAWTEDIYAFLGVSAVPVGERAQRATASARELRAYLGDLFAALRRRPRDDLLSALVAAEERGERLAEQELFSNVLGLINASHETTTNLIGNTVLTLLRRPEWWRRLTEEPALVPGVIEEGLRYESPVQMLGRQGAEDMPLGGVTVARGERLVVLLGAANRDPEVFPDPDRFDPTRPDNKHLAFAGGPHYCLGAALGRLEGQLALEAVSRRLPQLRLAPDAVRWRPYPVFRGLLALPVEF
jgi:cytochrome P450